MKTFSSALCRLLISIILVSGQWQPVAVVFAESDNIPTMPSDMAIAGSDAMIKPAAAEPETPKAAIVSMRGLTLPKNPLTMDFQDAEVRDVLHLLALKSGLNIIYGADVAGPVSVHLDRVPFDQAFQTILTLKNLVALPMGPRIIRVISSATLTAEQSLATTFTRVFRLNYADARDVKNPIDAIRSAAGRKGVSSVDSKTNSIIITDTVEGLKEVEDLIPVLDRKPQQVDIESKIVEVTLDKTTEAGITWAYAANGGEGGRYRYGASTNDDGTYAGLVGATGTKGVVAESPGNGGTGVSLNGISSTGFSFLTQQGTYMLRAQLSALATQERVKILSTPHIVTTNNQEANINVVDNIPYSVTSQNGTSSVQSVQFIQAGVKLTVKPIVNADRRITLHVKPEVSNPKGTGTANLPPTVNTRNAETTVLLRDGETIAIGGLIKEGIDKSVTGIPFLMDIPILGYLFKTVKDVKSRTELIVFVTPKIAGE